MCRLKQVHLVGNSHPLNGKFLVPTTCSIFEYECLSGLVVGDMKKQLTSQQLGLVTVELIPLPPWTKSKKRQNYVFNSDGQLPGLIVLVLPLQAVSKYDGSCKVMGTRCASVVIVGGEHLIYAHLSRQRDRATM